MPEQGNDYIQRSKVTNIAHRLMAGLSVYAIIIGGFVLAGLGNEWPL